MSFFDDPPLRDFPDHAFRRMLENPVNLRELIAEVYPHLVERMDFSRAEYEPREFLMEDWRQRECDLFVRVPFRTGQAEGTILICILLEHQSSPDPRLPLRTLVYGVGHWEREWKAWTARHDYAQPLVLTPILPLVFYTGPAPWNVGLRLADLFPDVPELRVFAPQWAPLLWNLSEQDPAVLLASASAWLQTLAVVRTEEEELAEFESAYRQVWRSLDALQRRESMRALDLLGFVLSWMTRRRPRDEVPRLRQALHESLTSEVVQREVELMGSKLGPTIEDVARSEERVRSARRFLLKLLGRFGTVSEAVTTSIDACQDLNRLEAWFEQAAQITSLEDFHPE